MHFEEKKSPKVKKNIFPNPRYKNKSNKIYCSMVATVPQNVIPEATDGPNEAFSESEYSIKKVIKRETENYKF